MHSDQLELLKLLYDRAGTLNSYWNLYIAVALGAIGLLASGKRFTQDKRIKIVLSVSFVVFALSNLDAILSVNHQRNAILHMIDSGLSSAAQPAAAPPDWQVIAFQLFLDALFVSAVWFIEWHSSDDEKGS